MVEVGVISPAVGLVRQSIICNYKLWILVFLILEFFLKANRLYCVILHRGVALKDHRPSDLSIKSRASRTWKRKVATYLERTSSLKLNESKLYLSEASASHYCNTQTEHHNMTMCYQTTSLCIGCSFGNTCWSQCFDIYCLACTFLPRKLPATLKEKWSRH